MLSDNARKLISKLIKYWENLGNNKDNIKEKALRIKENPKYRDSIEKEIVGNLIKFLKDDEWSQLPQLITEQFVNERQNKVLKIDTHNQQPLNDQRIRKENQEDRLTVSLKLKELKDYFEKDFLGADKFYVDRCAPHINRQTYQQVKAAFVKFWIDKNTYPDSKKQKPVLDDDQAAAIAAMPGHAQVIARAGSGKTTVLVSRALFLLKHCNVSPSEILILAFNFKAVIEIQRRLLCLLSHRDNAEVEREIAKQVDIRFKQHERNNKNKNKSESEIITNIAKERNIVLPHVMTFHAMAHAIVNPEENILYDDLGEDTQALSNFIGQVINEHLKSPGFEQKIRKLMLDHYRKDWESMIETDIKKDKKAFLEICRSLPRKSLNGEYVKSFGEKAIADFLFEHGIPYKYEPRYKWDGKNYHPDFTIETQSKRIVIEYFGLEGDPSYDKMSKSKRDYWAKKNDWVLIELSPREIMGEGIDRAHNVFKCKLEQLLKSKLENNKVNCKRLSENEILDRIKDRSITITGFTKAIKNFIEGCRKQSLSSIDLQRRIESHLSHSSAEKTFIELAQEIYASYLEYLQTTGNDDFTGLMQRSVNHVSNGQTEFKRKCESVNLKHLKYLFIDEYQDFSELFHKLVCAIRKQNPNIELFCVGDDWQAINGFAGSETKYFEKFSDYVKPSQTLHMPTNYRSTKIIVDLGNALMKGLGERAKAYKQSVGTVFLADIDSFKPSLYEEERHSRDNITPIVLRLVGKSLDDGSDIVMLCRKSTIPGVSYSGLIENEAKGLERYLCLIRSFFPENIRDRITISTVHKFKGLEKQTVIILDTVASCYPLIHQNWSFDRVLGKNLQGLIQEERRLLYVALTRATENLFIITNDRNKSPFLKDLNQLLSRKAIDWADYPPINVEATRLIVKVGNQKSRGSTPTKSIKDKLKAEKYNFHKIGWANWWKSICRQNFCIDSLKSESWTAVADGVEVQICDNADSLIARYFINMSEWHCDFDNLVYQNHNEQFEPV